MKKFRLLFPFIVILLIMTACSPGFLVDKRAGRIAELEKQLDLVQKQRLELENKNEALRERIEEITGEIGACKTINQNLSLSLQQLSKRSDKIKTAYEKQKSVLDLQNQVIKLLDDTKKSIETSLKDEISAKGVEIQQAEDKLKVVLLDKVLFDSGSIEIKEDGKKLLLILADTLRKNKTNHIVVQGYTDNIPLGEKLRRRFPSNWELSAARAASVVRFLQEKGNLDPERLSIKAYGSRCPVASNRTEEGRAQNRRIEIILGPSQ